MDKQEALEKFQMWYFEPIEKLQELDNGAGGFVAFMVGLALYERFIKSQLKQKGIKATPEAVESAMNDDLCLSDQGRKIFWRVFRNGLLHSAMPLFCDTGYILDIEFTAYPQFKKMNGKIYICINPWEFTYRVIGEFKKNPDLILVSKSNPLPSIKPISYENLIDLNF
jgi:hypothetical protein